jgi:hypothetical protein
METGGGIMDHVWRWLTEVFLGPFGAAVAGRAAYLAPSNGLESWRERLRRWRSDVAIVALAVFVGSALGDYLELSRAQTLGLVGVLSWLGPEGARPLVSTAFAALWDFWKGRRQP